MGIASPAPMKARWRVAVEFMDGTTIQGADATDVIDRWGRLLGWSEGRYLSVAETKERAATFARGFYGAEMPEDAAALDDWSFLCLLANAKVLFVVVA